MEPRKARLKLEHSVIPGLREILEALREVPEIDTIIPGRISRTRHHSADCTLKVQAPVASGLKCVARSGNAAQEVFLVTSDPDEVTRAVNALA